MNMRQLEILRGIYDVLQGEEMIPDTPASFCSALGRMMLPCNPQDASRAVDDLIFADPPLVRPWGRASVL